MLVFSCRASTRPAAAIEWIDGLAAAATGGGTIGKLGRMRATSITVAIMPITAR